MTKIAFEQERDHSAARGVRLQNSKSKFNNAVSEAQLRERFEKAAEKKMGDLSSRQDRGVRLAKQFMDMLRDKTLPQNKTMISLDFEKEIRTNLLELGIELNSDESETDGMGSIAIDTLLIKGILHMRDRINELEYKLMMQDKKIAKLLSSALTSGPTEHE